MHRDGPEKLKNDKWQVCRLEGGGLMRVYVGTYDTYREAEIAHSVAKAHLEEQLALIKAHAECLKPRIVEAIERANEQENNKD